MRDKSLDGLRGVAALGVVAHHLACAFFPWLIFGAAFTQHARIEWWFGRTPLYVFLAGDFMVLLFFVLSGYVLAKPFFHSADRQPGIAVVRRHVRLAIPYLVVSLVVVALCLSGNYYNTQLAIVTRSGPWLGSTLPVRPDILEAAYLGFIGIFFSTDNTKYNIVLDDVLRTFRFAVCFSYRANFTVIYSQILHLHSAELVLIW